MDSSFFIYKIRVIVNIKFNIQEGFHVDIVIRLGVKNNGELICNLSMSLIGTTALPCMAMS